MLYKILQYLAKLLVLVALHLQTVLFCGQLKYEACCVGIYMYTFCAHIIENQYQYVEW